MLGILTGNLIRLSDGERLPTDVHRLLGFAMSVTKGECVTVFVVESQDVVNEFLTECLKAFPFSHNGGRMTVNALVGVNRVMYHVTLTNADGGRFRFADFDNLIRYPHYLLPSLFGGRTEEEAAYRAICMAERMGLDGVTIGASAQSNFIRDFGRSRYLAKFPPIDRDCLTTMRSAYMGGYVMALPGDYEDVVDYDVNSLYPYVLATMPLPFGTPEHYVGAYEPDDDMPRHIDVLTFRADLKPDGHPFLTSPQTSFEKSDQRVVSTHGFISRALTDVDQELLEENYETVVYERTEGWKFRQSQGFFTSWVDSWADVKREAKGALRNMSKLVLNSFVGKFGTYPRDVCMEPYLNDNGELDWRMGHTTSVSLSYPPVSMFVTAYARRYLIDAMRRQRKGVIYANTDGFMVEGGANDLDVSPDRFGAWKIEGEYERVRILKPGLYQGETSDGHIDLISSGIQRNTPIPWEDFHEGSHVRDDYGMDVVL